MKQFATVIISVVLTILTLLLIAEIMPYRITLTPLNRATVTITEEPPITLNTKNNYTYNIYRIHISADCLQNHSVGNEWYSEFSIDGENIYDGQKISVPVDVKELIINTRITEKDKAPDTSEKTITLNLEKVEPTTVDMTITENGGAYKGNTALWEVTVSVELIEKE